MYGRGDAGARLSADTALSSVLVVVLEHLGLPHVLLTRRSGTRTHAGEVAFPGGKNEPGETDVEAALREAQEEVGLPVGEGEPLGNEIGNRK